MYKVLKNDILGQNEEYDMKRVAFAGTFDPITNGHLWVIEEGLNMADEVIVMIAHNSNKKTLFTEQERKSMIDKVLQERDIAHRVKTVLIRNEYVAQSAQQHGCSYLIRGIRSALDFDYESLIQKTNTDVLKGAKTLFVMPPRELESVSSSFVKSLIGPVGWHWNIKNFLPSSVYDAWLKKYIENMVNEFLINKVFTESVKNNLLDEVFSAYGNKWRFYHNIEHIAHALQELQWLNSNHNLDKGLNEHLLLAILAHDIIYNSEDKEKSDEEQSAIWFNDFAKKNKYPTKDIKTVCDMIDATSHFSANKEKNEGQKILCSIDLAILAQHTSVYDWYTDAIRKEYSFVNDTDFYRGRLKALKSLSSKESLFDSDYFEHYEDRAKNNLLGEINKIESKKEKLSND